MDARKRLNGSLMLWRNSKWIGLAAAGALAFWLGIAFAAEDTSPEIPAIDDGVIAAEINSLQDEITSKEANIDQINRKIDEYKRKIEIKQQESASLARELDLLENRIAKTQLDIQANSEEIDAVNAELAILDKQIQGYESQLERDRRLLADILQTLQGYDNDMTLQLLFGSDSFSELFERLQQLENVNSDLTKTLQRAEAEKEQIQLARAEKESKRERLVELQATLEDHIEQLENETGAKESLIAASQQSEAQFQALVYELRQESAYIDQQIAMLQGEIEAKLNANDQIGAGSSVLSWPVDPGYKGISTYFHDPTYPFRHLFEHSGLDIPQAQGTPVVSAAPGYVAWTRTGRLYGNYVMIIHTDGIATLYAHLSKISVVQDQFIGRGETLGLSGGLPGTAGAGLSTGPHLHFEVRKDGIPTDPLNYLVSE